LSVLKFQSCSQGRKLNVKTKAWTFEAKDKVVGPETMAWIFEVKDKVVGPEVKVFKHTTEQKWT